MGFYKKIILLSYEKVFMWVMCLFWIILSIYDTMIQSRPIEIMYLLIAILWLVGSFFYLKD
jgi:hypothetical protein